MRRAPQLLLFAALLMASCSTLRGGDSRPSDRLQLYPTEMTTIGARAVIRGTIENTFDKPVHGVRYLVTIIDTQTSQKVDVWQSEVDATLQPGQRAPLNLEVESESLVGRNTRLKVKAEPAKVGSKSMPPPAGWKD